MSQSDQQLVAMKSELAWWRGLAIALMVVGAVIAFLLVREVRSHRADNARLDVLQQQIEAMGGTLSGSRVADLTLVDTEGQVTHTAFASSPATLVLLLSTHCSACEASAPAWAQVAAKLQDEGVTTWMVVTDAGGKPEASPRWAGLPPHAAREAERTWLRDVPGVPSGLLVDNNGVVRKTWLRPIEAGAVDEVVQDIIAEVGRSPG